MPVGKVTDSTYQRIVSGRSGYGTLVVESAGQIQALNRIESRGPVFDAISELVFGETRTRAHLDDDETAPTRATTSALGSRCSPGLPGPPGQRGGQRGHWHDWAAIGHGLHTQHARRLIEQEAAEPSLAARLDSLPEAGGRRPRGAEQAWRWDVPWVPALFPMRGLLGLRLCVGPCLPAVPPNCVHTHPGVLLAPSRMGVLVTHRWTRRASARFSRVGEFMWT